MSVMRPECPHLSRTSICIILSSIWLVSIIMALPTFLFATISPQDTRLDCIMIWPDGNPTESLLDHGFQITFFFVTYVVPMLGLTITYTHLYRILLKYDSEAMAQMMKPTKCENEKRKVCIVLYLKLDNNLHLSWQRCSS